MVMISQRIFGILDINNSVCVPAPGACHTREAVALFISGGASPLPPSSPEILFLLTIIQLFR